MTRCLGLRPVCVQLLSLPRTHAVGRVTSHRTFIYSSASSEHSKMPQYLTLMQAGSTAAPAASVLGSHVVQGTSFEQKGAGAGAKAKAPANGQTQPGAVAAGVAAVTALGAAAAAVHKRRRGSYAPVDPAASPAPDEQRALDAGLAGLGPRPSTADDLSAAAAAAVNTAKMAAELAGAGAQRDPAAGMLPGSQQQRGAEPTASQVRSSLNPQLDLVGCNICSVGLHSHSMNVFMSLGARMMCGQLWCRRCHCLVVWLRRLSQCAHRSTSV